MKWFKHFSDNHRGRSISQLMDEFGHMGPCCYWILVEICAEKLDKFSDRNLTEVDCSFNFPLRFVRQMLRISPTNLGRLLDSCQTLGLFSFEIVGNNLKISMPMLLDLLEYDQKKSRQRRAHITPAARLDTETDTDTETESETEGKKSAKARSTKVAAPDGTQQVIAKYCEQFKAKYGTNPPVGGKVSGMLKTLTKDFGKDRACDIVTAYLQMPDKWFITKRHDVATLCQNLNSVVQFLETGKFVTQKEIQNLDKSLSLKNRLERLDANE